MHEVIVEALQHWSVSHRAATGRRRAATSRVHRCTANRRTPLATSDGRLLGRVEDGLRDSPRTKQLTSVSSMSVAATPC